MFNSVCIENSAVTRRSDDIRSPDDLFWAAVRIAKEALGGQSFDGVYFTTQTLQYCIPNFRERFAEAMGIDKERVEARKVFSNMQPVLHEAFRHVAKTRERVLMVGVEGLSFLDNKQRPTIIAEALGDERRAKYGTMMNAIAHLTEEWMHRIGLTREEIRPLLRAIAIMGYERSYQNPCSQFWANGSETGRVPIVDWYDSNTRFLDERFLLKLQDCSPGNTTQAAATAVGPKGPIQVLGWSNVEDERPMDKRMAFGNYPKNEAAHKAFKDVLGQAKLSKERLLENGILEIHDAFGSLLFMTLMEMEYLNQNDLMGGWEAMDDLLKERINPMGGLKSGHPLGATALVRLHEIRQQLLGIAPKSLQVTPQPEYGALQSVHGPRDQISMTLLANRGGVGQNRNSGVYLEDSSSRPSACVQGGALNEKLLYFIQNCP